jgi:uncharacterized membrane protein YfcA
VGRRDEPGRRAACACSPRGRTRSSGDPAHADATALVLTSALGVLAGSLVAEHVSARVVRWVAGLGFIAVGVWVLLGRE